MPYTFMKPSSSSFVSDISAAYPILRIVLLFSYFLFHSGRGLLKALVAKLACVASISVRFESKERGTRVKTGAKRARVKEQRGEGKKGRVSFLSLTLPLFHFLAVVPFFARSKPKIPVLVVPFLRSETTRKRLLRRLWLN